MALQVASLYGVLSLDDSGFNRGLNNAKSGLSDLGGNLQRTGGQISLAAAPIAGLFGVATNQAINFDEAVTNTGAILGYTRDQINSLALDLLEISGGNTRAGPQAVAEAFYEIVGGVQDATTHMAILDAAIMTSQAGNAQLAGTTQALISTMNSYGYTADQAAMVSDVMTQTVGMGTRSMDEFAAALPQVTGLAASLGIPLESVGSMMAFLTTKGNTASQAATQLGANMSALMKPNEQMKDALAELGFNSGEAAIEQMGLLGALQAVAATATAQTEGMAALLGTQEAVRGSTSLMGQDFLGFNRTFVEGVAGITAATEQIQMGSAAAEMDLFNSQLSQMAIIAGYALMPSLLQMLDTVRPIVTEIISWISQNPELTAQIGILAIGAVVLGGVMAGAGLAISGVATVVGLLTKGIGLLLSPVGLLALGIAGILYAANSLYPGGLPQLFIDASKTATMLAIIFRGVLTLAVDWVKQRFAELLITAQNLIDKIIELKNLISGGLGTYAGTAQNASTAIGMVTSGQKSIFDLAGAFVKAVGQEFAPRAGGGDVTGGQSYLVGEQGPELFTPGVSGYVSSNGDTQRMMGNTYNITINASTEAGGRAAGRGFLDVVRARGG